MDIVLSDKQQKIYDELAEDDEFLKSEDPYAREVARVRLLLEAQALAENPAVDQNRARPLVEDMRAALAYDADEDMEMILRHQARVLDNAFRRLLGDADITYEDSDQCEAVPALYIGAFKAQDLYRRTASALKSLKTQKWREEEEKNSTNEL